MKIDLKLIKVILAVTVVSLFLGGCSLISNPLAESPEPSGVNSPTTMTTGETSAAGSPMPPQQAQPAAGASQSGAASQVNPAVDANAPNPRTPTTMVLNGTLDQAMVGSTTHVDRSVRSIHCDYQHGRRSDNGGIANPADTEHGKQLRISGARRFLQQRDIPPDPARVHDPGWGSHGYRRRPPGV